MDSNRLAIAGLIFIVVIIFINFAMYIIVRSWAKGGDSHWMTEIRKSLNKSLESSSDKSMDELHQKMEELQGKSKEEK